MSAASAYGAFLASSHGLQERREKADLLVQGEGLSPRSGTSTNTFRRQRVDEAGRRVEASGGIEVGIRDLTLHGKGIGPEALTVGDLIRPARENDPLKVHREHFSKAALRGEAVYRPPSALPENPCIDLSGTQFTKLHGVYLKGLPDARYVDLSRSKMKTVSSRLFQTRVQTLILQEVVIDLVLFIYHHLNAIVDSAKRATPRGSVRSSVIPSSFLRHGVKFIDVSGVKLEDKNANVIDAFPFADTIIMRGCSLTEFPVDLYYRGNIVRFLDFSNNGISSLSDQTYQFGCHNMLGGFLHEHAGKKGIYVTLSVALAKGLVKEACVQGTYLACEQKGQGSPLHLDLRNNPLDKKTLKFFENFNKVKLSDKTQVVLLPGNFFIYCDLPKASLWGIKV